MRGLKGLVGAINPAMGLRKLVGAYLQRMDLKPEPVGQELLSGAPWTVPAGVYKISGAALGGSGPGADDGTYKPGGGGPELRWANDIDVTPGEVLNVRIGNAGGASPFSDTWLRRGTTDLLRANGGGAGGAGGASGGGTGGSGGVGDGGGNGGKGGDAGAGLGASGGGGAGGYLGNGGEGASTTGSPATGQPPAAYSGGGYGGDNLGAGTRAGYGQGVGLQGLTEDLRDGSEGEQFGGGGRGFDGAGKNGALRVMWGGGRSYPYNARDRGP